MQVNKTRIVLEGLDLHSPKSFCGITDVRHFVGRTSRSASEAFRDAQYACAIEKHTSDLRHAMNWFAELFAFFFWAVCALVFPVAIAYWIMR